MRYRVVRADPSGNITLLVLDPVDKDERPAIASKLMALERFGAEQVGFVCKARDGFDGRLEMAAGEFCGNASRACGMLLAKERGIAGKAHLTLEVSGSDHPVGVDVDMEAGFARAAMPLPRSCGTFSLYGTEGALIDLGGIVHFVTRRAPDAAVMDGLEPALRAMRESGGLERMEAYGVIFLHDGRMTPLVKVPAAGTLFWEGSCGSGSLAAAIAESLGTADGVFARDYIQPGGTIRAEVEWQQRALTAAHIGGGVTLDEPVEIDI